MSLEIASVECEQAFGTIASHACDLFPCLIFGEASWRPVCSKRQRQRCDDSLIENNGNKYSHARMGFNPFL